MSAYSDLVIAHGATNYWRLNEPSGTTAVDIIGGVNGTISGGVTLNQPGALSDGDKAMTFDGATGRIALPTLSIPNNLSTFSVECWVRRNSLTGTYMLVQFGDGNNYLQNSNGNWAFSALLTGGLRTTNAVLLDLQWHHAVGTYEGTTLRLYLDGIEMASNAGTGTLTTSVGHANIGAYETGTINTFGTIDEVAIYPSALTPAQIAAHYQARLLSGSRRPLPAFVLAHRRFPS